MKNVARNWRRHTHSNAGGEREKCGEKTHRQDRQFESGGVLYVPDVRKVDAHCILKGAVQEVQDRLVEVYHVGGVVVLDVWHSQEVGITPKQAVQASKEG